MTGIRELAEAQAYERRRRVRAFIAADPAPTRGDGPTVWRALAGGALLAIVLIVGVALLPSGFHP